MSYSLQVSQSPSSHGSLATAGQQSSSFNVAQAISSLSSTANTLASSSNSSRPNPNSSTGFRAPAHKHAHHLHSIPPREKSTRTLIIDHMLWVHGRTRFAQARAELGMTDRTGGPSSRNYTHRQRPENFEEDEEQLSDGEDVEMLKARVGGPGHPRNDDVEAWNLKQDLSLARSLRLRSEGVEKVVTSMLDQPPAVHPNNEEDFPTPPTSPSGKPHSDSSHPHTLPNGVRLRLALDTVINDLFARQTPPPPRRDQRPNSSTHSSEDSNVSDPQSAISSGNSFIPAFSLSSLPPSLLHLSTISGASTTGTQPLSAAAGHRPSVSGSSSPVCTFLCLQLRFYNLWII
jgi:hypothetical protein